MSQSDPSEGRSSSSPHVVYILPPEFEKRPRRLQRPRQALGRVFRNPWTNLVLFILTALSIGFVGEQMEPGGWIMSPALMAILLAHEMGHYCACRRHGVDATLPYFVPAPIVFSGTLGALILIRSRFPNRKALFDIGIAGPLAGFLVSLPILALGISEAKISAPPPPQSAVTTDVPVYIGEPLLLRGAWSLLKSDHPDNVTITLGPLGMAAWFGIFLTALNLFPIGQLDGGHILYSIFRERAALIAHIVWWICAALILVSPSWIVWVVLLRFLGRRHPPTLRDELPLGRGRAILGVLAAAIFVTCFIPEPILGSWDIMRDALRELLNLY